MTVYTRITRAEARKRYVKGHYIYMIASKMNPNNALMSWGAFFTSECGKTFDALVNEFHYYNCSDETGNVIHFYK